MELAKARVNATSAFLIGERRPRLHARTASAEDASASNAMVVTVLTTTLADSGAEDMVRDSFDFPEAIFLSMTTTVPRNSKI